MRLVLYRGKWYAAKQTAAGIRRTSLRTADREEAARRFRDFSLAPHDKGPRSVGTLAENYLAEKRKEGARSIQGMESAWRAARATFEDLQPEEITRELCRQYSATRRKSGVSDGTVIKELGVIRSALAYHKATGAVFEMPHAPPPKDRFLRRAEVQKLVDACRLPHLKLFVVLAWSTAGRASAILDLTWDRVGFDNGQIRLYGGQGRRKGRATVPMTKMAREALETAYEARDGDYVIQWAGKKVASVKRGFAEAARRAGLEDVSPHVLRHSAAVAMAEAGVPMAEIARYLGHTDPRVTFRVYAVHSPDHLRLAAQALE